MVIQPQNGQPIYKRGLILPPYLGDKMRAVAGLLLLLISLSGSQAQEGAEVSDVWPEVKALKVLLAELLVKQTILETDVNNLKAELTLGTQDHGSWFICSDANQKYVNMALRWLVFKVLPASIVRLLCINREEEGGLLRSSERHGKNRGAQGGIEAEIQQSFHKRRQRLRQHHG